MASNRRREPDVTNDANIQSFWSWFASVAKALDESDFQEKSALERLNAWMESLGGVSWELGPGESAASALTITPDGDASLINTTLRIIALAPPIPGWEFFPARRPRKAALKLELESSTGKRVQIDATRWRYVLFQYDDGKLDLVIEQRNLAALNEDDRYAAAVLIVDGLLGEALRLLAVVGIEPSLKLSAEEAEQASSIKDLAAHVKQLWEDAD